MSKQVLFLLDNAFTNDRRVYREAKTLVNNGFSVILISCKKDGLSEIEDVEGIKVIRLFDLSIFDIKNRQAIPSYISKIENLNIPFDIIHCHDQTMLAIGSGLKKNNKKRILIYDSHELFSEWPLNVSNYNSVSILIKSYIVRRIQIRREKKNSAFIDYLITVNESLANHLTSYFKLRNKALVLRNIPEKSKKQQEKSDLLREIFKIPKTTKVLVFIGANIYAKTLNLEQVIEEFANVKDKAIIFICAFNQNSQPIQNLVKKEKINNVFFHDLIKPTEIPKYLSSADVGLVPTWNKNDLSYWYALDNKLFEYMNAGIPILATAQPEYKRIIDEYDCGLAINADDKNAYIKGFTSILDKYDKYKENTLNARQDLNWENEERRLIKFYTNILEN